MPSSLPKLICASDGNHGLAVAAAAKLVGASAKVFLHHHVCAIRAQRIADLGAEIVWIHGTYDDSVDAALAAANRGEGILIADTSADANDRVVADVMRGYEWMANEIVSQLGEWGQPVPTHLFVQAGVGGLAAALTVGLNRSKARCQTIVVEPESVACVGLALQQGQITRLPGDLQTAAEMLSCGEASLPALNILRQHGAAALAVSEESLTAAETLFASELDLRTTPSGATGLAGLLLASFNPAIAKELQLNSESRVLLIATEAATKQASRRA